MADIYMNGKLLSDDVDKIVIPDNEWLPFIPITKTMQQMKPGQILVWPISKAGSVKQVCSKLNAKTDCFYKYVTDGTSIIVCKFPTKEINILFSEKK